MWVTTKSDQRQAGKSLVEDMWNEERMTVTSKDGLYQGKLDSLVAIDLADPNDPNLGRSIRSSGTITCQTLFSENIVLLLKDNREY